MATLTIDVKTKNINQLIESLQESLTDLTPAMRQIGEVVRARAMECFERGTEPEGRPWEPSLRARREGGKTLILNAILRNSIHHQTRRDGVSIGTPVVYGAMHQFGGFAGRRSQKGEGAPSGRIPARKFLGIKRADKLEIRQILKAYIAGAERVSS